MANMKHHKHGRMSHKEGERTHKHATPEGHHDAHLRASDDMKGKTHIHNAVKELHRHKEEHHHMVEKHHVEGSKAQAKGRNSSNTTENRQEPGDYQNHISPPPHKADKPGV